MPISNATNDFLKKCGESLSLIKDQQSFRETDKMIDFVFVIGKQLFVKDVDNMSEAELTRVGGKLTGIYAYLGNIASRARAERDVYLQKKEEIMAELSLKYYTESESKITVSKARAKLECAEIDDMVIAKEHEKNNLENLLGATDKMIGFIQSVLRGKNSERFRSDTMHSSS